MSHVLIVEDEPAASRAMVRLCRLFGLEATPALTVASALAELAANPAPDFILLDLMLPDGNGAEVLAHVRSAHLASRVAVTTGASDPAMLDAAQALGPDLMMSKPVDIAALRTWLSH